MSYQMSDTAPTTWTKANLMGWLSGGNYEEICDRLNASQDPQPKATEQQNKLQSAYVMVTAKDAPETFEEALEMLLDLETKHEEAREYSEARLAECAAEIEELTDERDQYYDQVARLDDEVEDMEDRIEGLNDKVEELTEAMSAMKKEAEEMNADGWKIIKENKELKDEVIEERKKTIEANEKCVKMIETLPNDMDEYSWDIKQELWVHQDESSEEEEEEEEESWYGPHRICAGREKQVEMSAGEWKTIDAELDRVARTMWDDKESA